METIPFVKMQGLGNDFIVINDVSLNYLIDQDLARRLCHRQFGVGADQILWLKPPILSRNASIRMDILNFDGSTAEMCGNGLRAVGLYLDTYFPQPERTYLVETIKGLSQVRVESDDAI